MPDHEPDDREVVAEVRFNRTGTPPPPGSGYIENPDAPGQYVTPQYLDYLKRVLGEAVADRAELAKLDPETKRLAEELAVLHLPEHKVADRVTAEATRVEIYQSSRVASYLIRRGWRFHPEHEVVRWVETPNRPSRDLGIHIDRNPDGTWPTPDPEDFYDAERIAVNEKPDGRWIASHPCGAHAEAKTKARAHAAVVQQLLDLIDKAHQENETR